MRASALLLAAAATFAFSCSKPSPPTFTPVSATATQLTKDGIGLSVVLNATNPNAIALSAQGVTAHVVLDKTIDLGTITTTHEISLPASGTTPVTVPLSVQWTSITALLQVASSPGDVPYAVDGTVTMGGTLLNVAVPFHIEGTVTHDQIVSSAAHAIPGLPLLKH